MSTKQKQVHVKGLKYPLSVSCSFYNHTIWYVVCETGNKSIIVYNSTWDKVWSFGGLKYPVSDIISPLDTIIVADGSNNRISEFTFHGYFLRHIVVNISDPSALSFSYPYLWVTSKGTWIYRYKLYKSEVSS